MGLDRVSLFKVIIFTLWCGATSAIFIVLRLFRLMRVDSGNAFMARSGNFIASKLMNFEVEVIDPQKILDKKMARIIVGNHQSNWDMPIYGARFPRGTYVVGKVELLLIPLFGIYFYLAGNFLLNRGNKAKARQQMEAITTQIRDKGVSIWIFPEGTRNQNLPGQMLPFKLGAFRTALESGAPILPLVVEPYLKGSDENLKSKKRIRIKVLESVDAKALNISDALTLSNYVRSKMQEALDSFSASASRNS